MLTSAQMSVLRYHADAGDRIAYYTALASFGDAYGELALGVVLNNTLSGISANSFFWSQTGGGLSNNVLAQVSLALMRADFDRRDAMNGADLTVDDIQEYHRDVFDDVAGAPANAWTPNMYLETFESLEERQIAWNNMLASNSVFTFSSISSRRNTLVEEYVSDNPQVTAPLATLINATFEELLSFGVDSSFADWLVKYDQYLDNLSAVGLVSMVVARPNGPYEVGINGAGNMIGGNGSNNTLVGTTEHDVMIGQAGDDTFIGGNGSDRFYGGSGDDAVDYSSDSSGIIIQVGALQGGTADEWAAINEGSVIQRIQDGEGNWDFAIAVEEIIGTAHDDRVIFYGNAADFFIADDVDTILQGGGNTALGDLLDFSAMSGVQGGLNIIWNSSGAINFNMGSWAAAGVAEGFEAVIGSTGDDYIAGDDQANGINGHVGADRLFGGGGDDFLFFDAEDIVVNGGLGRDVAVALGNASVTVNMTAQELEVCIGGGGVDEITCAGSEEALFAAGSGGADTFNVIYDQSEGPKVLWGGTEADTFNFSIGNSENEVDWQLGIAVVRIEGLTEEMFAYLTIDDLGLAGIDLSKIDVVIINPEIDDSYTLDGAEIDVTGFETGWDPELSGMYFGIQASTYLGGNHQIQSLFATDVEAEYSEDREYYTVTVKPSGTTTLTANEGSNGMFWSAVHMEYMPITMANAEIAAAIEQIQANAANWFAEFGELAQEASDVPIYPFFVVGGSFVEQSLVSDVSLMASTPSDPGTTPFDWLMVA